MQAGRGAGSPSANTRTRRAGGRPGVGVHSKGLAIQAWPLPLPCSPASSHPYVKRGTWACGGAGGRTRGPPSRSSTSAACTGTGQAEALGLHQPRPLTPLAALGPLSPPHAPYSSRRHTLTVHEAGAGWDLPATTPAEGCASRGV